MVMLIVPVIIISSFDSYKYYSYLSIPSIILAISGMMMIFVYASQAFSAGTTSKSPIEWFNAHGFFGRIGLAMYIFDGNAVVINIRGEARDKH